MRESLFSAKESRLWADTPFGRVAAVATAVTLDGAPLSPAK